MASFSVSVTDIKYASDRTGYKDVTITNAPAAGITVSITSGSSYFNHRIPEAGVYRIYTLSINDSSSWRYGTARFMNNGDITDYVDISLSQYPAGPQMIDVETESDKLYIYPRDVYSNGADIFVEYNSGSQFLTVYFNENMTDRSESANWVSKYDYSITDTGFLKYRYTVVSNYDPYRECKLRFYKSGTYVCSIDVFQNGYPSSSSGCTSPITFEGSGGNRTVTLKTTASDVLYVPYGDASEFITASSSLGTNQVNYVVTAASNTLSESRRGTMLFENSGNGLGFTNILQAASSGPIPTLSADPSFLTFTSASSTHYVTLAYADPLTTNASLAPSWLSVRPVTTTLYAVDASSFSTAGSTRSWNWELQDANMSLAVPITQTGPDPQTLSISPTSNTVDWSNGTRQITVTSTGITVNYSISVDWIQFSSVSGNVYRFSYTSNTTSSSRTGTITFYGGELSETYTLTQEANLEPSVTVSPTTQNVSSSSGSVTASLTTNNINTLTYSISDNWVTFRNNVGLMYNFDYTANTSSSSRTAVVTFTGTGPGGTTTATYTIVQEGASGPTPILSVTPTSDSVSASSGTVTITLRTQNVTSVTYSSSYPWIHYVSGSESNIYVFSYDANSGVERTGTVTFTATGPGGSVSKTYTLIQAGTDTPVLVIDPTTQTVDYHTRAVRVTVYTENIDTVTYSINDTTWLHFSSIPSPGQYSFIVDENTGSSSRTNTVTFTGGGLTRTYTLTQTGTTPPTPVVSHLETSPASLRYYSTSSIQNVTFNMPVDEVSYSITYEDGQGWLSTGTAQNGINFIASPNAGNSRRAVIRFYETSDPTNYVDVPVIQGSGAVYWDSIWVENIFVPNVQDDYHYNIMISNPHFNGSFEGLTPIPYQGIDVPRLVEDYISSSFEPQVGSADWASMYTGYCMASIYNLNGSTPVLDGTFSFWNDWSGKEKRYDYTKSINDPINHKGTSGMIIPFCVYSDSNDNPSFSTLVTDMEGNYDTNTYSTPLEPFEMRTDVWYNVKKVDYRLDDQVLFSYDMTHCGGGAFIYRNRFGGWDSFLLEGNISKTDNYTKLNYKTKGIYNSNISNGYNYNEKRTSDVDIDTTYEAYTGWLTDDEAERLVFHLASSPKVYFQDLVNPSSDLIPVRMTLANAEYKKFRNGRRLVNYTILFEKTYTEKLKD